MSNFRLKDDAGLVSHYWGRRLPEQPWPIHHVPGPGRTFPSRRPRGLGFGGEGLQRPLDEFQVRPMLIEYSGKCPPRFARNLRSLLGRGFRRVCG